jgi:hypothetical protein
MTRPPRPVTAKLAFRMNETPKRGRARLTAIHPSRGSVEPRSTSASGPESGRPGRVPSVRLHPLGKNAQILLGCLFVQVRLPRPPPGSSAYRGVFMGRQRLSARDHLVLKILTPAAPCGDVANGQQSPLRAQNGTTATARTPVLPEATPVGVLCAQLRRPRPWSATSALRRLWPSPSRRYC